jgi:hypothetical protein
MVAGILMQCGLDIGSDLPNNLEDPRFNLDLLNRLEEDPINSLIQSVTDRNSSSSGDWGWKYPRAVAYLDMLRDHLTNPHLILVLRDPAATAGRIIGGGREPLEAISNVVRLQQRNIQLLKNWQVPSLIVSYERAIGNREETIKQLCEFAHLREPEDTSHLISFMEPGSYKNHVDPI